MTLTVRLIPDELLTILDAMKGLIDPSEGRRLADLAASVPAEQAIVELGSHRGLSSCWLAAGSRLGNGAHVTCIDPWPMHGAEVFDLNEPWAEEGASERWAMNVASVGVERLTTPLRSTAIEVAQTWAKPVGLLFHDADHAYEAVRDDYLAWLPFLAPGAWVVVHDYYGADALDGQWVRNGTEQQAIADHILPSGQWSDVGIVENLWMGRRA